MRLPDPPPLEGLDALEDTRLRAVTANFIKKGQQLIVSYVVHGIMYVIFEDPLFTHANNWIKMLGSEEQDRGLVNSYVAGTLPIHVSLFVVSLHH